MKQLLTIILLATLFTSCKKSTTSTTNNTSYITYTIDGTTTVRDSLRTSVTSSSPGGGIWTTTISAFDSSTYTSPGISLYLQYVGSITLKTYNENGNPPANTEFALISYGNPYAPGGTIYANGYSTTNPFTITVTATSSNNIQGTFQGNTYEGGDKTETKKVITNGSFNVSW